MLERIAAEFAREVWVVAPEPDQSGVSHAVSLHHPVGEIGHAAPGLEISPGRADCGPAW